MTNWLEFCSPVAPGRRSGSIGVCGACCVRVHVCVCASGDIAGRWPLSFFFFFFFFSPLFILRFHSSFYNRRRYSSTKELFFLLLLAPFGVLYREFCLMVHKSARTYPLYCESVTKVRVIFSSRNSKIFLALSILLLKYLSALDRPARSP